MAWTHSYTMYGGGPWGVRLAPSGDAVVIAKLRARSKGATCGLLEGDAVMRINEIPTNNMDSQTASRLLENAGQELTVDIARGSGVGQAGGRASVTSQRSSLVGMTSSPAPAIRLSAPEQPGRCITPTLGPVKRESQVHDQGAFITTVNTETQQQQFGSTKVTKVTREINTEGKRSVPESPLVRSSVTSELRAASPMRAASPSRHRSVQPPHQRASQSFMPLSPDRASPVMKSAASPIFAPAPQNAYRPPGFAPQATPMKQNPDSSFTMTVGMGSLAPARSPPRNVPQFKVKKFSTEQAPQGTWAPGGPPNLARPSAFQAPQRSFSPAPQRAYSPAPAPAPAAVWQPSNPPAAQPSRTPSQQTWTPSTEPILRNPAPAPAVYEDDMMYDDSAYVDPNYSQQIEMEPIDITKYQHTREFSSDDEYFNEYGQVVGPTRKKKIYADSSFYDDPEHKYPTIEEQIKMARKVATSLMAPQNKEARGHKMFVKRRKKADKWNAEKGEGPPQRDYSQGGSEEDEPYYAAAPWHRGSVGGWEPQAPEPQTNGFQDNTWGHSIVPVQPAAPPQRPPSVYAAKAPRPFISASAPSPTPMMAPPAPPAPPPPAPALPSWENPAVKQPQMWAPRLPQASQVTTEQESALSLNEFELMRLAEQKNTHDKVAPAVAFSLASDLKSMKGKGGKMFANRAARADQHVVDDSNVQVHASKDVIMRRIAGEPQAPRPPSVQQAPPPPPPESTHSSLSNGTPTNRLADMIKPTRGQMTPWEAAQKSPHGGVEQAFTHLGRIHGVKTDPVFAPAPQGFKANVNDYNNQYNKHPNIAVNKASVSVTIPDVSGASSGNYNNKQRAWHGGDGASGNFRKINFKSPLGAQNNSQPGVFQPTSMNKSWSPQESAASSQIGAADGLAEGSYCDL